MAITTRKHVEQHISDITPEMIGLATRIYDFQLKENIYLVESTSGTLNQDGEIEEYRVRYIPGRGFSCTCKSGQHGFANVRHKSGVCCHCRIACAAAAEERAALAEITRKQLIEDDVITLSRLNDYQTLAAVTSNEQVKASALRTIAKILLYRGDVVLENGKWIVATPVAA
jgi:hypothetical protein